MGSLVGLNSANVRTNGVRTSQVYWQIKSVLSPLMAVGGGKCPTYETSHSEPNWPGGNVIFTNKVSELAVFLNHHVQNLEEVLKYLVTNTMVELDVSSVFMCALNRHNKVELVAHFGIEENFLVKFPSSLTLFDDFPLTDSLRNRKTIWINSLPSWGGDYPNLVADSMPSESKTFFSISIERDGTPVAVLGFFATSSLELNPEIEAFLEVLSSLISLNFFRHSKNLENRLNPRLQLISSSEILSLKELTERQTLILKMMADEYTNSMISEILGYSESTIRQESIKIYAKLNCNGRKKAAQLYKAQLSK